MKQKLVVIGNGMAGVKCVEEIYELAPQAYDITIIGAEPHPNYNRVLLSKVLQGNTALSDITLNDWQWYSERGIDLLTGEMVERINAEEKWVRTASGKKIAYDRLIIATGSSAFMPALPGIQKPGVTAFRNMEDCQAMMEASQRFKRAAVIGGGLLGLEAARGLLNLGMEVDVVHNAAYLMNRQLDRMSANLLKEELMKQGMRFWLNKRTEKITGVRRANGLLFSDGTTLAADLIVVAIGISPNLAVTADSGIRTNRAIIVNDYMETNIAGIYAVGECAEHQETVYGLVAPLYEQAKVLARHLCELETDGYHGSIPYAQLKVSGVEVFSAGVIRDEEAETALQHYDAMKGTYKKVTMQGGIVAGAVLFGDSSEGSKLLGYLKRRAGIGVLKESDSGSKSGGADAVAAAMPDGETVCACNGVSKSAIVAAIQSDGLESADQVRDKTKASGSCGGCRPMVEALVAYALSGVGGAVKAAPICSCTELDPAGLKEAMLGDTFSDAASARRALEWRKPEGCFICQAAMGYYLRLAVTSDAGDVLGQAQIHYPTLQSVLVAASMQGESSSQCQISHADRFEGGGPSYIAAELEKALGSLASPSMLKASVSAGALYPAGVLVHDVGISASPAGWELYIGGHMESPVKQAQLLIIEGSEQGAVETAIACMQLYRQSAFYGEAVWKWLERTGLIAIREKLLDPDFREELLDNWRLEHSLETCTV
ncbi:nitrite reductase (NADH) large subunit [Paenibacillus algorifonticola]|uniref:Nitrite reductase (NADH) large subunit n=1 Tax=Paenibacillus algorifonticola TaxID=684063 RepID=A0A1I1YHJ1_9BACL|nr:FAD-dependent oxidoreductase [Paenibacillus algorifonticola]SFE17593.1 nitrite reductase (NADH) large subunit [Paenibacillus algorifonticola]